MLSEEGGARPAGCCLARRDLILATFKRHCRMPRPLQYRDIRQVLAALRDAPVVAGAVFLSDETVWRAAALRSDIQIGACRPDLSSHVAADLLFGFERPCLGHGARQEATERRAMIARAADAACARPVRWRLQGFGRARLKMRETSRKQARHGRAGSSRAAFQQRSEERRVG